MKYAAAAKSLQSCPTLCDPMDSSPPGSSVPGILQARVLEWVAISFSQNEVYLTLKRRQLKKRAHQSKEYAGRSRRMLQQICRDKVAVGGLSKKYTEVKKSVNFVMYWV